MFIKKCVLFCFFVIAVQLSLSAQTHIAVPLGHPVYHVLEQAQMRGLLRFLPTARPYTRAQVLSFITEILNADDERRFGGLTIEERRILQQFRQDLNPQRGGLDLVRGTLSTSQEPGGTYFSTEFGFGINLGFSASFFPIAGGFRGAAFDSNDPDNPDLFAGANHPASGDFFTGIDSGIYFSFMGDLGRNLSYGFTLGGSFIRTPRAVLGRMNTFSPGLHEDVWTNDRYPNDPARRNRRILVHSEPLTHFPFSYRKNWDGSVWFMGGLDAGGFEPWPDVLSVGYFMMPEMAGTALDGHIFLRVARLDREWASMANNSSLILNQSAQQFLAAEVTFAPLPWISFSALTGILEYDPMMLETGGGSGLKEAAEVFQNAFSINVLEFNVRNHFRVNFGTATIWPKRFHLGYMFPLADTFLTQNNTGDFDNSALFINLLGQYPGLGKLWFSFFADEISLGDINRDFFNMSRMMIAYQFGMTVHVPWFRRLLPFNSLTISYTRVEPYNYTHTREIIPGYGDLLMETNWVNFGRALGHYIPPNADQLLVRFTAMPTPASTINFQYQLIRHGANYGDRAVGGSSHWSELDPWGRQSKPNLRKFFLRDGAYQWTHMFRFGGSYSFTSVNLPISAFAEFGWVYSFFTDIDSDIRPNSGSPSSFRRINTPEYPRALRFIAVLGVRIFPKW
ncbi:MAG: hypothetical protein FWC64_01100 [Treponema sp.]|nr:hypothetical protein [Treponema sp.]